MFKIFYITLAIIVNLLPVAPFRTTLNDRLVNILAAEKLPALENVSETTPEKVPEKKTNLQEITTGSASALFIDFKTGEVLFEKEKDKRLPMASTTKLMTALVVLDKLDLNEVVTVPNYQLRPLDAAMGLTPGSKFKVSELLNGLLIESAADAALTFSNRLGGEHEFAALMNEKAKIFGLTNTQFTNSVGYDDTGHFSTAADLIGLARIALTSPTIASVVAKPTYTITDEAGRKYFVSNTNKLLGNTGYKGVKTGTTIEAGECLISLYDDGQRKIIGVVLASPNRFTDTNTIIGWTKEAFSW